MRGRRPSGPGYVNRLNGAEIARQRLEVILETMQGTCRVMEACERLGVCTQRFHQLRQDAMEWALAALQPGRPGRPPRALSEAAAQIKALQEQIADLELELRAARARAEIALILPNAVHSSEQEPQEQPTQEPEKKNARKTRTKAWRPLGMRKNT